MEQSCDQLKAVDVITATHLTLTVGADGPNAEQFLQHISLVPGLTEQIRAANEPSQLLWIIGYWEDQMASVGLDSDKFRENCSTLTPLNNASFVWYASEFICEAAERHSLPNITVPLRTVRSV